MYGDSNRLDEMKKKLNSVSPSFCMAKWMHVALDLSTGKSNSCYLPRPHQISIEEIAKNPSALHNTAHKKEQRRLMLKGDRPAECSICWEIEDLPGDQTSDRHWRSVDSWTIPFFDEVSGTPWNQDICPSYMEISFSSTCNFKCSYCAPSSSSRWWDEISKFGPYQLTGTKKHDPTWSGFPKRGMDENNPYVEAFWKWWPELVQNLMYFRITGGEPLLSKDTFKVLDWLKKFPQPKLNLSINSNMGVPQRHIQRFIETVALLVKEGHLKSFLLHTSIDALGKQGEYLRNGLVFKDFDRNIRQFLESVPDASIAFMCAFNNLSVIGFKEYLEWFLDLRIKYGNSRRSVLLDIPHLMEPNYQSVRILTEDFQIKMDEYIAFMTQNQSDSNGFRFGELDKMKRIRSWMAAPQDVKMLLKARRDFYLFFREHDRRRGSNFIEAFPGMQDFWNLCKSIKASDVFEVSDFLKAAP